MNAENIKIISSKIDRETKEGKIVIEVEEKWKLEMHSYQIADTGDYDGCYEITNGKIRIFTKDDGEDLPPVVDALNKAQADFYLDDSIEFELHIANERIKLLEERCSHDPVDDLEDGRFHCPACYKSWTYEEYNQLAKDSNQVNPNQNLSDKARDHAKEVEKFYSPSIEAYRLRAKNSFEAGYNSAKEIPQIVNLLAKFFLKERSESDPDSVKLEEMDDYFMEVYQKNTGNSFSFARLKAIEAVLIKYGYQLPKEIPDEVVYRTVDFKKENPKRSDRYGIILEGSDCVDSAFYSSRLNAFTDADNLKIKYWLEPIQLKDLLAK